MKIAPILPATLAILLGFSVGARSQAPAGLPPRAAIERIMQTNVGLIKRQEELLARLQKLEEEAKQLKVMSKRA